MKMNKTCLILILTIAGLFLSGTEVLSQQAAGQLYEKALYLEEAKGELQGAIDLYNRIAENRSADQSFQAKALLHMGLCYEKLGKQEAVKSYQRLVNNFPAQKNEVAIARERLALSGLYLFMVKQILTLPANRSDSLILLKYGILQTCAQYGLQTANGWLFMQLKTEKTLFTYFQQMEVSQLKYRLIKNDLI